MPIIIGILTLVVALIGGGVVNAIDRNTAAIEQSCKP